MKDPIQIHAQLVHLVYMYVIRVYNTSYVVCILLLIILHYIRDELSVCLFFYVLVLASIALSFELNCTLCIVIISYVHCSTTFTHNNRVHCVFMKEFDSSAEQPLVDIIDSSGNHWLSAHFRLDVDNFVHIYCKKHRAILTYSSWIWTYQYFAMHSQLERSDRKTICR